MKITSTFPSSFDLHAGHVNVRDIMVAPSERTTLHNHHDRECWSVTDGEGVLFSNGRQIVIRPGNHIEFMPFEAHTVENRGAEDLHFKSHWYVDWDAIACESESSLPIDSHLMIETAFPTPNGPLHLGHLSGAYLVSDILKRCCELTGVDSFSYCGTYGHTNHIDKTAAARDKTYADLVTCSEDIICKDFELFQAGYDAFLPHAPTSSAFDAVKLKFVELILMSKYLVERTVEHPYSESSGQFVCESYVAGQCPHCGGMTIGMECETCGLYQDECKLIEPFHSVTQEKLVRRPVNRLYLRVDRDIMNAISLQMYRDNTAASRIGYDRLQQYIKDGVLNDIPVSSLRGSGVPVKGQQVLTVVMERALRSYYGLSLYSAATRHLFFCGIDNLCGSGILMPYVLKILGVPDTQLPIAVINHFCLLENRKFSTGANHAIWANEFLQTYPPDLVRWYLSHIHCPTSESNFRIEAFFDLSNGFVDALIDVFANGRELIEHYVNGCIEAGPWLRQDIAFYRALKEAMRCCLESYMNHAPGTAVRRSGHLLEVIGDYIAQSHGCRDDRNTLRTKQALVFHAYRCLAYCLYPAMPALATRMMNCLGADRARWHADRHVVPIVDYAQTDLEMIIGDLNDMKRKVQR